MAERRMFANTILESDLFLDMPVSSRYLYINLCMNADDEGFLNCTKKIVRMTGSSDDDIKILLSKNFIIAFDSGVIVITHWKIHNYIQKDRFKETLFQVEKRMIRSNKNGVYSLYTECIQDVYESDTECIQDVYSLDTQYSIGKDSKGKYSLEEERAGARTHEGENDVKRFQKPTPEEVDAYCRERNNGINGQAFCDFYESKGWMIGKNHMKDWKSAVRTWESKRTDSPSPSSYDTNEFFNAALKKSYGGDEP